jgi:hypothetical protein
VYHALITLKKHYRNETDAFHETDPKYATCCASAVSIIQQRQVKLLDRDLIKAAFWLTSFGCQSLADEKLFVPVSYHLNVKYFNPLPFIPVVRPLEKYHFTKSTIIFGENQEEEEVDYAYTGDEIPEDELEEVAKTRGYKNQVLAFLIKFLSDLIIEDLDREIAVNVFSEVRHQVEESLQFFFCNPETIAKCRHSNGDIKNEVELWNWIKYRSEGRIRDHFAQKVISIITIPASEASCERSFSRQKRIMDHLHTRSNPELLRARFIFEVSND